MVIDTTGRSFPEWCDNRSLGEFLADCTDCTFTGNGHGRRDVTLICHADGRVVEEVVRRPRPAPKAWLYESAGKGVVYVSLKRPTHPAVIRWREEHSK